jgi:hypothetical protein
VSIRKLARMKEGEGETEEGIKMREIQGTYFAGAGAWQGARSCECRKECGARKQLVSSSLLSNYYY